MRTIVSCAMAMLISAGSAFGQSGSVTPGTTTSCVDVRIGNEQYYNCLNRQMGSAVPYHRLSASNSPVNAGMPGPAAGLYDQAATREQLGTNFGKSSTPQRPPTPIYPAPLHTR